MLSAKQVISSQLKFIISSLPLYSDVPRRYKRFFSTLYILEYETRETALSNMDHITKSIGLTSELDLDQTD